MRWISIALVLILGTVAVWRGADAVRFSLAQAAVGREGAAGVVNPPIGVLDEWLDTSGLGAIAREKVLTARTAGPEQEDIVAGLLARAPLSPLRWLSKAALDASSGKDVAGLLTLSSVAGPNEGPVMVQRGILGVALWDSLRDDQKALLAGDLASSWSLMSGSERRGFQQVLASKPERIQQEVQAALGNVGGVPAVDFASRPAAVGSPRMGPGWFDMDWMSRRSIIIDNSEGAADLKDYQVKVVVPQDGGMRSDFADIRFTDRDGKTLLGFWREGAAAGRVTFWVKMPFIPARGVVNAFVYYGNPDASDDSDGARTFTFFDDFSDRNRFAKQWTIVRDEASSTVTVGQSASQTPLFATKRTGNALISDHQFLYLADEGARGANSAIYKLSNGKEIASFRGPPCTIGGAFREDTGTLLLSSCDAAGAGAPEIWEVDRRSGQRLKTWTIRDPVYNAGVLVAARDGEGVLVVSYDRNFRLRIRDARIANGELTWTEREWLYSLAAQPRGVISTNDGVFVLGRGDDGCRLTQLELGLQAVAVAKATSALSAGKNACAGPAWDGETLMVASGSAVQKVKPELASSLKIDLHGENQVAYAASQAEFSAPVTVGVKARATGAFPGLLWLGDRTANTPNEAQNVLGMMPHPNGDPSLIYVRQRERGEPPSSRAFKTSGPIAEAQTYEARWSAEEVSYTQGDAVLGTVPSNVPRGKLRIMFGGGTFNQPRFATVTNFVYVRAYAKMEPAVTLDETATNPFPERSRVSGRRLSQPPAPFGSSD
jgi:hypothetical protein